MTYQLQPASTVFGIAHPDLVALQVPVFAEKGTYVPELDPHYQFNVDTLVPVLWGLVHNKNTWLSGHTGTGKSTLIMQVGARLNWPVIRVNFDSEISRMDLVGRDVLRKDPSGATVSAFVDGILPQALQQPAILLCDEVDFIRPDVAYVFQRVLEDEGLLISEDGGRLVKPNAFSRIVATANTQGQGDDFGIYQGARAQSMAFLDRFTVWVRCEYLKHDVERGLVAKLVPEAENWVLDQLMKYVMEHRTAFEEQKVAQPLSPRSLVALAQLTAFYKDNAKPLLAAAQTCILGKCNSSDRAVLVGILDRVAKENPNVVKERKKKEEEKAVTLDNPVLTEKNLHDAYYRLVAGNPVILPYPDKALFTGTIKTSNV